MNKYSSIKTCIIESWKEFATNTKAYFKYLWIYLLIAGIGYAFFSAETNWISAAHITPMQSLVESGLTSEVAKALYGPTWQAIGLSLLALIVYLISNYIMVGGIYSQIRFYKATNSLPAKGAFCFWNEVKTDSIRSFTFDILLAVAVGLSVGIIALIAWPTSWWVLLLAIPVIIYWMVIGTCGRLLYVVEKLALKDAVKGAFKTGHHKFGGYCILLLLTSIPLLFIAIIAMQPVAVFHFAHNANSVNQLLNEASGIPPYTIPLHFVTATLAMSIFGIGYALQQMPLALFTSAVHKK